MLKRTFHELDFRASRALTWCAFEGSEIEDAMFAMYRAVDAIHSTGGDEDCEAIIEIMERWALDYAQDILDEVWSHDPDERQNIRSALAHLRKTDGLHRDIERRA